VSRRSQRRCAYTSGQAGFALVAVIFLIVVLAALAAFAVRIAMAQYGASSSELLEARAQAAADAGIEYEANLTLRPSPVICASAPISKTITLTQSALKGFVVTVTCTPTTHQIYSVSSGTWQTYTVFALTARASSGTYGGPDYVARSASRNVTLAPP
jgi:MSHA biogenesis protein MshP